MLKRFIQGSALGLGCAVLVLGLWATGVFERLEFATWSWRVAFFAPREQPHPQIKVVLLDQASLDWGKTENQWGWPWPREAYAPILDFLKRGGAKVVAFDVILTEPSIYGVPDDAALGQAIRNCAPFVGAVVLGTKAGQTTNNSAFSIPGAITIEGLEDWLKGAKMVPAAAVAPPIPEVMTNSTALGDVAYHPDPDAQCRRASLFGVWQGKPIPSLALAAYLAANEERRSMQLQPSRLRVGSKVVPLDREGKSIIRYQGKGGIHPSFSAAAVIQSELRLREGMKPVLEPAIFKDCYVFFGFSAPGLLDLRPTPLSRVYPGTEVHAFALDNLLTGAFLREAPSALVVVSTLLLSMLGAGLVAICRTVKLSVLAMVCLLPVPAAIAFLAYAPGLWWPVVGPEIAVATALVAGVVLNYATEGRQKAFLNRAFKHYLGADVIQQIVSDPSRLCLGGEKRELTLFFSDIEKFSTFSEKLDPEALTSLLNAYLSDMTDIILEEGGYLDKYIGDAIVAFWNAPLSQRDHAVRGLRALLRCQRRLAARRAHYFEMAGVTINARIGMNTGLVTVGNMGSRDRFNYTVLGDAANLAARLEGANKVFGTYNLIAESTWERSNGQFQGRELGRLKVVGREQPVRVFEVIGFAGEAVSIAVSDFERGYRHCLEGRWDQALSVFSQHPQDPPSVAYAALCKSRRESHPERWEGIWSLDSK